ncbi:MAG: GNAT family N-acetyltransferase [Bacilli bacterium]
MLNKKLEFHRIFMQKVDDEVPTIPSLPEHYFFRLYEPGDALYWAEIECSVGEFASEKEALSYFNKEFQDEEKVKKRMLFLCEPGGTPIGTYTAWDISLENEVFPLVHWVAIHPTYQGKGLGKAIVAEGLRLSIALNEEKKPILLKTQTWSAHAVALYRNVGFTFMFEPKTFGKYENTTVDALAYLESQGIRF